LLTRRSKRLKSFWLKFASLTGPRPLDARQALTAAVDPARYPILIVTAESGDGDPRPSRNVVLRSGG